jgi:hypothetical protein
MDHEVTVPASSAGSVLRAPALRGMHSGSHIDATTNWIKPILAGHRCRPAPSVWFVCCEMGNSG